MGFGKIRWVDQKSLCLKNCFTPEQERQIVEHMNADHQRENRQYLISRGIDVASDEVVDMLAVDQDGFYLSCAQRKPEIVRVSFVEPVYTMVDVRKALVAMANI